MHYVNLMSFDLYPIHQIKNLTNVAGFYRDILPEASFYSIIFTYRPDLIDSDSLYADQHIPNLNNAFDVAERELGLARLLDAEDVDVSWHPSIPCTSSFHLLDHRHLS